MRPADRRLVKAAALLRVAAHACGRNRVAPADALLLEFVFAHAPRDVAVVRDFVLAWIAKCELAPPQFGVLVAGLVGRACAADATPRARAAMAAEAATVQQEILAVLAETSRPALRGHLWLSEESKTRAEQTINSMLSTRSSTTADAAARLHGELRTAVMLQCGLEEALPSAALARALAHCAQIVGPPLNGEFMARCVHVTRLEKPPTWSLCEFWEVSRIEFKSRHPLSLDPYAAKLAASGDARHVLRYMLCVRSGMLVASMKGLEDPHRYSLGRTRDCWPTAADFCADAADAIAKAALLAESKLQEGYRVVPGVTTPAPDLPDSYNVKRNLEKHVLANRGRDDDGGCVYMSVEEGYTVLTTERRRGSTMI